MFLPLCVWLYLCLQDKLKSRQRILMKCFGGLGCVISNSWLDFGGYPDHTQHTAWMQELLNEIFTI